MKKIFNKIGKMNKKREIKEIHAYKQIDFMCTSSGQKEFESYSNGGTFRTE